jgi:hypothetical protein
MILITLNLKNNSLRLNFSINYNSVQNLYLLVGLNLSFLLIYYIHFDVCFNIT